MDEKGVFPVLVGGLGNQMFILAAAHIVSKIKQCPLYLTKNHTHHNHHNVFHLDYKKTIFKAFGIHLDQTEEEFLQANSYKKFHQGGFEPWNPNSCEKGSILESYFQYYPPLAPFEHELRSLFKEGLSPFTPQLEESATTAFLHIRRGDYLAIPHVHYNQPLEYYKKAIDILQERSVVNKILLFSDDIEWVKQQPMFQNPLFYPIEEPNELIALAYMTQCKAGAICANSTFSWWGAFLGCYEERKPIVVPKRWICDPVYELFPKEWISI